MFGHDLSRTFRRVVIFNLILAGLLFLELVLFCHMFDGYLADREASLPILKVMHLR